MQTVRKPDNSNWPQWDEFVVYATKLPKYLGETWCITVVTPSDIYFGGGGPLHAIYCKRIEGAWWKMIVSLYEYTLFFLQQFTVTITMMHLTKAVFCLTILHFSNCFLQIIVQSVYYFNVLLFLFYVSGSISPWTHISKQCCTRQGYCFRVAGLMWS